MAQEETLPRHQLLESRRLAACVLAYVACHHDAVAPLFELLAALEAPTAVDFSFVLEAYEAFAKSFSAAEKAKVREAASFRGISTRDVLDAEVTSPIPTSSA